MSITRRRFTNFALGGALLGWLVTAVYPAIKFLIPPEQIEMEPEVVDMGSVEEFPPGSSKNFKFGKTLVILVRSETGSFNALAATCTHLDCTVQFRKDKDTIWCACHNGVYDLAGRNISGPPPKPLEQFDVNIVSGKIFIRRMV